MCGELGTKLKLVTAHGEERGVAVDERLTTCDGVRGENEEVEWGEISVVGKREKEVKGWSGKDGGEDDVNRVFISLLTREV